MARYASPIPPHEESANGERAVDVARSGLAVLAQGAASNSSSAAASAAPVGDASATACGSGDVSVPAGIAGGIVCSKGMSRWNSHARHDVIPRRAGWGYGQAAHASASRMIAVPFRRNRRWFIAFRSIPRESATCPAL